LFSFAFVVKGGIQNLHTTRLLVKTQTSLQWQLYPIPEKIQQGWTPHDKAIKGDNGLQYEISEHYQDEDTSD